MLHQADIQSFPEFSGHTAVVELDDPAVGLRGFIAIYNEREHVPSLGATRVWSYAHLQDALRDALRLSKLMSYKSIMAGLPYGGAKAVLCEPPGGIVDREAYFKAYGAQVNRLGGRFVTGSDIGVGPDDVHSMRSASEFIIGDGVNAAYFTAYGVLQAIRVCLRHLFGSSELTGRRFAIQGAGKTGGELIKLLYTEAQLITVSDVDQDKLAAIKQEFPNVRVVSADDIYSEPVDIFSPCALGGILNQHTISRLNCRAVVGSANNQLAAAEIGEALSERGIIYAPDYIVNAGGLISVVDQYQNQIHSPERILQKIREISPRMEAVLSGSQTTRRPTIVVADDIAHGLVGSVLNLRPVSA